MSSTTSKNNTNNISEIPMLDLETYISRYAEDSNTRLERLLFLCNTKNNNNKAINDETIKQARILAENQIKSMGNIKAYKELFDDDNDNALTSRDAGGGNNTIMYDTEWINTTQNKISVQLETLKARLSSSQSHLSKESIRQSYIALSNFYKKQYDYQNSIRCLLSSRDYCTTNLQIATVCIDIMEVGILWKNYVYVHTYYTKAKHTNELFTSSSSSATTASSSTTNNNIISIASFKLEAAEGLALLAEEQYYEACMKFFHITPGNNNNNNSTSASSSADNNSSLSPTSTLISQEDIVLYIAILALATFTRKDLQYNLLDNYTFQQRCREFTSLHVQDALKYYARADYGQCLNVLQAYKPMLLLDIYLHDHIDNLFQRIVQRSVVTYFQPYSTVSIPKMANTFQMTVDDMEELVESLLLSNLDGDNATDHPSNKTNNIQDNLKQNNKKKKGSSSSNKITNTYITPHKQLRIHSRDSMIRHYTTNPNHIQRKILQKNVSDMLYNFQQTTTSMMLRLSCLENDLIVTASDVVDPTTASSDNSGNVDHNRMQMQQQRKFDSIVNDIAIFDEEHDNDDGIVGGGGGGTTGTVVQDEVMLDVSHD